MNLALDISLFCLAVLIITKPCFVESVEIEEYYPGERDALLQLRDYMSYGTNLHSNWTGPPCINNQSRWIGIACSNWHVIQVVLEGIQLSGSLPPSFLQNITFLTKLSFRNNSISGMLPNLTNLVHLEHVVLSYNHFTRSIPLRYTELPNLKQLELQVNYLDGQIPPFNQSSLSSFNVSYNHLEGPIPQTLVLQSFPRSSYDHNPGLCGNPLEQLCPPSPTPSSLPAPTPSHIAPSPSVTKHKKGLQAWLIALVAASAAVIPILIILFFFCYYKKVHREEYPRRENPGSVFGGWAEKIMHFPERREDPERPGKLEFMNKEIPAFDLDDLLRASAQVLGKGNLGASYRVTLETGPVIAVKRLRNMNEVSKKEFIQHMQFLGKMKHENLVEIISFYYSKDDKLVISEFVPDGTLFDLLHENRGIGRMPLGWVKRLAIIKGIAKGVAFLHQSLPSTRVPHANLKSSNVVIQHNSKGYHIKLTDYGYLSLLHTRKYFEKLAIRWTPEFGEGRKLTPKADVYCFGIILLEVITGKIPGKMPVETEEEMGDLSDWVRMVVNNDWSTDILDVEILGAKEGHDEMLKLAEIALLCTDMTPERRPQMSEVLRRIEEIDQQVNTIDND